MRGRWLLVLFKWVIPALPVDEQLHLSAFQSRPAWPMVNSLLSVVVQVRHLGVADGCAVASQCIFLKAGAWASVYMWHLSAELAF